jgi:hypothetical protein
MISTIAARSSAADGEWTGRGGGWGFGKTIWQIIVNGLNLITILFNLPILKFLIIISNMLLSDIRNLNTITEFLNYAWFGNFLLKLNGYG